MWKSKWEALFRGGKWNAEKRRRTLNWNETHENEHQTHNMRVYKVFDKDDDCGLSE